MYGSIQELKELENTSTVCFIMGGASTGLVLMNDPVQMWNVFIKNPCVRIQYLYEARLLAAVDSEHQFLYCNDSSK